MRIAILTSLLCALSCNAQTQLLEYSPANCFEECFPLGNGRIGAMSNCQIDTETIILNDITLWSGAPQDADDTSAILFLPEIQRLIFEEKNDEAQKLMYDHFVCKGAGSGHGNGRNIPYGSYEMFGKLIIEFPKNQHIKHYSRILNLENGFQYVSYKMKGRTIHKTYYIDRNSDILTIYIQNIPHAKIRFERDSNTTVSKGDNGELIFNGQLNNGTDGQGMKYELILKVDGLNREGYTLLDSTGISVINAKKFRIIASYGTNYQNDNFNQTVQENLIGANLNTLKKTEKESENHRILHDAVIHLKGPKRKNKLPTSERLIAFQKNDNDPQLVELYYNYGKYLFLSSCREGLLPPNLQGLWTNTFDTPWNGDYHLNINVQMNHWFVEACGLSSLHLPLIELTQRLVEPGQKTAKAYYNADGWVTHSITNIHGYTSPGEHPSWGATNTCGAWLCRHLWQHFQYTLDTNYLRTVYPTLEGSARFFASTLTRLPNQGYMVTAPSSSPENSFFLPNSKVIASVCAGPTMDNQIIRELFEEVLQAADILNIKNEQIEQINELLPQLPPTRIGKQGQILEWLEEYEEPEPQHRHVSHLFGLYPGFEISPIFTPELAQAAEKTLALRGDGGTGWSIAWKINFWARLQRGDMAYKLLRNILSPTYFEGKHHFQSGTSPNLFCQHPPFQIDGNFGATAGIVEMLVQSHNEHLFLLPALPQAWKSGNVSNIRIMKCGRVSFLWKNYQIKRIKITAPAGTQYLLHLPNNKEINITLPKTKTLNLRP